MKKIAITLLSVPLGAFAVGCGKDSGAAAPKAADPVGAIAVVNLDTVAKAMNWTDEMDQNLQKTKDSVSAQLINIIKPAMDALNAKRDEIAKAVGLTTDAQKQQLNNAKSKAELEKLGLSAKQIDELAQAFSNAYNEETGANQKLNQIVNAQRDKIVQTYRTAVAPAVRRVAIANNKTIVLTPAAEMLYNDPATDISNQIVNDLQHSNAGKVDLPPIPEIKLQGSPTAAAATPTLTPTPTATPTPTRTPAPAPALAPTPAPTFAPTTKP